MSPPTVIALGGNALDPVGNAPRGASGSHLVDRTRLTTSVGANSTGDLAGEATSSAGALLDEAAAGIAAIAAAGSPLLIVHGNGPQVGRALLRAGAAEPDQPPLAMDDAVAQTQGELGYAIATAIDARLTPAGVARTTVAVVTRVVVDLMDPAFGSPDKPIGPFMSRQRASRMARLRGWSIRDEGTNGWRRVVPSPVPRSIVELTPIVQLVACGAIVIAGGGGGAPVVEGDNRTRTGVAAVVDKDLTASLLASALGADRLVMVTAVDRVALDFGTPDQRWLDRLTAREARAYLAAGQFPSGSMGPKIRSILQFLEGRTGAAARPVHAEADSTAGQGGAKIGRKSATTQRRAAVCGLYDIEAAWRGTAGTQFVDSPIA